MQTASVVLLNNGTGTGEAQLWPGGKGVFACKGAVYGAVDLQFLLPDGINWVTPTGGSLVADGGIVFELAPGKIRANATATAVYATATRIPE